MSKTKHLPKPEAPLENPNSWKKLKIQPYDADNLYPQNVLNIVSASATGMGCLERYRDYLEGDGLASEVLAGLKVNRQGETLADIHKLASDDLATFEGFALHINYNAEGKVVSIHSVPFENVRLGEPDAEGIVRRVAVHPDWSGQTHWDNTIIKVSGENIDYIDIFNPNPAVVQTQIARDGGISAYKGQILYVSGAGYLRYPLAYFDAVLTDMSTDEGLSNLMLRNARNNFLPAGAFVHFVGSQRPEGDGAEEVETDDYSDALARLQGDTRALAILDITCESQEEVPQFVPFVGKNLDKDFTETSAQTKENIYCKFGQEGFLALRNGKVGFSGTLVKDANDDYARRMVKRQRMLSRSYVDILSRWAEPLGVEPTMASLAVVPLTYAIETL